MTITSTNNKTWTFDDSQLYSNEREFMRRMIEGIDGIYVASGDMIELRKAMDNMTDLAFYETFKSLVDKGYLFGGDVDDMIEQPDGTFKHIWTSILGFTDKAFHEVREVTA